ncbi:MAG: hypothetical protein M9941_11360 [Anaerolineae bacterium]|nr:hypothetical protein [Anaerolineae bacterium]
MTNSTISGNTAYFGGGIQNSSGTVTVINSTLSDNFANSGGGIHNFDSVTGNQQHSFRQQCDRHGGIYNASGSVHDGGHATLFPATLPLLTVMIPKRRRADGDHSTFPVTSAAASSIKPVAIHLATIWPIVPVAITATAAARASTTATTCRMTRHAASVAHRQLTPLKLNLSALSVTTTPGQQVHTPQAGSDAIGAIPMAQQSITTAPRWPATRRPPTNLAQIGRSTVAMPVPLMPVSGTTTSLSLTVTTAAELSSCITLANNNESPSPTADTISPRRRHRPDNATRQPLPQITTKIMPEGDGTIDGGDSMHF